MSKGSHVVVLLPKQQLNTFIWHLPFVYKAEFAPELWIAEGSYGCVYIEFCYSVSSEPTEMVWIYAVKT